MGAAMSDETSGKRYQVVGAAALLTQDSVTGPMTVHVYRGAVVGPGARPEEIRHNLSVGLLAEIPADGAAGVDAAGVPLVDGQRTVGGGEPGGPEQPAAPAPAVEPSKTDGEQAGDAAAARRDAARAKLPADGAAPDGRASKDVWVEYAVAAGYDRATVEATDRDEIKALFKG
jgi:hypothetical protein